MKYSPKHQAFIIDQASLNLVSNCLLYAMKKARQVAGIPAGRREMEGALQPIDHCEKAIIDAAKAINIELGADWGSELDLTDIRE